MASDGKVLKIVSILMGIALLLIGTSAFCLSSTYYLTIKYRYEALGDDDSLIEILHAAAVARAEELGHTVDEIESAEGISTPDAAEFCVVLEGSSSASGPILERLRRAASDKTEETSSTEAIDQTLGVVEYRTLNRVGRVFVAAKTLGDRNITIVSGIEVGIPRDVR